MRRSVWGQIDRSRVAQLLHDERVGGRNRTFEQDRAAGGRQIRCVVIVLHHHGNSVKRRARPFGFAFGIERASGFDRFGIDRHDRMQ